MRRVPLNVLNLESLGALENITKMIYAQWEKREEKEEEQIKRLVKYFNYESKAYDRLTSPPN